MSFYSPISKKNPEPNNRQLLTLLVMFIGLIIIIFGLLNLLITNVINWIPVAVEQKLGALILPAYEMQAEKSTIQTNLNQLLDQVEIKLPAEVKDNRDYQILYIPEATVNALAIPGDKIVIYQGLLEQIDSENELVMILGHELGHFANRDHLRGLGNALLIKILLSSLLGDLGGLQSAVDFTNIIANAQFSQKQEMQADEFALKLLYKYYGHVAGATDFFEKLSQENKLEVAFLSTHPNPQERVKKIQELIIKENYPLNSPKIWQKSSLSF
jgi:Zn-dependent protease with chaperone function